jgi:hypothetical protein
MLRKGMPERFCDLMSQMDSAQVSKVITSAGLTPPLKNEQGCRQGDPLSCLRWNFLVDPLCDWLDACGPKVTIGEGIFKQEVNHTAFADDFTFLANSNKDTRTLLGMANTFFSYHGISFSAMKTVYAQRKQRKPPRLTPEWIHPVFHDPVTNRPEKVQLIRADEPFRVLGAFFTMDLCWEPQLKMLDEFVLTATAAMKNSYLHNLDVAVYVANASVIPKLLYPLQVARPSMERLRKWDSQITSAIRTQGRLAKSMTDALLRLPVNMGGLNLMSVLESHVAQGLEEFRLRTTTRGSSAFNATMARLVAWKKRKALPCFPLALDMIPTSAEASTYSTGHTQLLASLAGVTFRASAALEFGHPAPGDHLLGGTVESLPQNLYCLPARRV